MSTGSYDGFSLLSISTAGESCYNRIFWEKLRDASKEGHSLSNQEVLDQWIWDKDKDYEEFTECICTHPILEVCVIKNVIDGSLLEIGNICVKRWMPKIYEQAVYGRKKKCDRCNLPHKNRKDNYCNNCRDLNALDKLKEEEATERAREAKHIEGMRLVKLAVERTRIKKIKDDLSVKVLEVGKKCKGFAFEKIVNEFPDYCTWVISVPDPKGQISDLKRYILLCKS